MGRYLVGIAVSVRIHSGGSEFVVCVSCRRAARHFDANPGFTLDIIRERSFMRTQVFGYLTVLTVAAASACGEPTPDQGDEAVASTTQAVAAPGKLRTPAGEFDIACAHEVPSGAVVDLEGNVMQDGKQVARFTPCTGQQTLVLPRITKPGLQPPTTNGWVEASWANATTISGLTYFNSLNATFTVPTAPSSAAGQLIYLFPSVEANGAAILQPVLQWGN